MISVEADRKDVLRAQILLLAMFLAFAFLGVNLWRVQVLKGASYRKNVDKQSMRRVRIPATRGTILDRNGICLADNRPSYALAIYAEELRRPGRWENTVERIDRVVDGLAAVMGVERVLTTEEIRTHIKRRLPLPLLAWHDLSPQAMARWAESPMQFPGVDIQEEPVRVYPHGTLAAHVIGYVGRAEPGQDASSPYHYYLPEMEGKVGLELGYNGLLAGVAGGQLIRVDASGYRHHAVSERDPIAGESLQITIDADVQKLAEDALGDRRGAAVVLDVSSGEVLALASAPTFDPGIFTPAVSREELVRLKYDEGRPFFNRATGGAYPPGSIFKPIVAAAAMEGGHATAGTTFACPGYFDLGNVRFRCWHAAGHGMVDMRKAIEQSCNAYFCQLGLQCGYERIYRMAEGFGIGRRTGIDLPGESRGLLPDAAWKQRRMGEGWRPGDTCNVSIGQGALMVSPVQMAVVAAALANGGHVYRPRLMRKPGFPGEEVGRLDWSAETSRAIRGGMRDVVEAPTGTGKRARLENIAMGGKTGTAEFGPRTHRRKYCWMIAFAPFEDARYAVAMVIEDAVSGGIDVAPRIHGLMAGVFGVARQSVVPAGDESSLLD